ncbi:MAG: hypothetical protein ACXWKN_08535 [Phenylobacterium sp.]
MRNRISAGAALCALFVACAAAAGPAPKARRPTLEGAWTANFVLVMEAPDKTPDLVVSASQAKLVAAAEEKTMSDFFAMSLDPEVPLLMRQVDGLPVVRGEFRTRVLVHPAGGKLPYTPAARKEVDSTDAPPEVLDNPEQRSNSERCLASLGQPPIASFNFENVLQLVRTRDAVAIHTEYGDEVRVVPITDRHGPKALWGKMGDSIGRWEGETLVVETVGQPDDDRFRLAPFLIVSGEATVVERFTPVSDRELLYQFTVIDPKVFTGPWMAEFSWYRTAKPMYEHACHEGNYSLPNILAGARHEEAVRAAAGAH